MASISPCQIGLIPAWFLPSAITVPVDGSAINAPSEAGKGGVPQPSRGEAEERTARGAWLHVDLHGYPPDFTASFARAMHRRMCTYCIEVLLHTGDIPTDDAWGAARLKPVTMATNCMVGGNEVLERLFLASSPRSTSTFNNLALILTYKNRFPLVSRAKVVVLSSVN